MKVISKRFKKHGLFLNYFVRIFLTEVNGISYYNSYIQVNLIDRVLFSVYLRPHNTEVENVANDLLQTIKTLTSSVKYVLFLSSIQLNLLLSSMQLNCIVLIVNSTHLLL